MTPVSAYLTVTALDGLVASGCVGLAIAICATLFFRLAVLAKATVVAKLILHSLFLIQMFLFPGVEVRLVWDVLHLTLVALYAFSRISTVGVRRVDALDWSFIAWALLGHTVDFLARLFIQWVVVPSLFERYLASLDGAAFKEPGRGKVGGGDGLMGWYHKVRLKLGRRRRGGYREQGQQDQIQHGMLDGRSEQHLLGDMEGQI